MNRNRLSYPIDQLFVRVFQTFGTSRLEREILCITVYLTVSETHREYIGGSHIRVIHLVTR